MRAPDFSDRCGALGPPLVQTSFVKEEAEKKNKKRFTFTASS